MSDRRLTPANARVAAADLPDAPADLRRVAGTAHRVIRPLADLVRAPGGPRDRQMQFGESLTRFEDHQGWSFVRLDRDGYVGYLDSAALGPALTATHWVSAAACHVYERPDIKSPDRLLLGFGCRLTALEDSGKFVQIAEGFVPKIHLTAAGITLRDPVEVAEKFLGTPYLWGGNSRAGIDCSGLVQAALIACGQTCPGDSDQQCAALGQPAAGDPQRGDLLFWKGHVALVADAATLIHATGHFMSVVHEPLAAALARIATQPDGALIAHKRLVAPDQ